MIESKRELQTSAVHGVGLVLCAGSERTHSEARVNSCMRTCCVSGGVGDLNVFIVEGIQSVKPELQLALATQTRTTISAQQCEKPHDNALR